MIKYTFLLLFFLLQILIAYPTSAGIADIYTSTSMSLYEFIQNKKCGNFVGSEYNTNICRPTSTKKAIDSMNDIVENAFFKTAAAEEVRSLKCEVSKIEVIRKNPKSVDKIKEDILLKLKPLRSLYESLLKSKFDYLHYQAMANQMRSYAYSSKDSELRYLALLKSAKDKESEAEQLHAAFEATIQSIWMGNSQTVRTFLNSMIKDESLKNGKIPKEFEEKFISLFTETSKELDSNRAEIEKKDYSNLDLKTKEKFSQSSYYVNLFSEQAKLSMESSAKLQCRLQAKYVKGNEYLSNAAFAASLLLSGGGALLSKAPVVFAATIGQATRAGQIAFNSSRVLLASGAGASTHLMLEDFDRSCLNSVKSISRKNLCDGNPEDISNNELTNLNEGNCALSVVTAGLPLVPAAFGLKNIYKNPLNLTRAPLKPTIVTIDDIDKIKKLDPYQRLAYREDLREIRAHSGRLGDKYINKLPELKGTLKEAFEGPIEQQTFKTGQVVWQIQRSNQQQSGQWFSTSVAKTREEAEELFNVKKWDNDRGQMRMFVVKDDFTAYAGKVAGGSGDQLYVPSSAPIKEVLEPLSLRSVPGGHIYTDYSKIPAGKSIDISTLSNDGSLLMQGQFVSFNKGKGKFDSITISDPVTKSVRTYPFEASDGLVVRDVSEQALLQPTVYPRSWSREIRSDGPVVISRTHKDSSGNYVQSNYQGTYSRDLNKRGDSNFIFMGNDGEKISFPREELNLEYSYMLQASESKGLSTPLKKNENYVSNLLPGDKIKFKAIEDAPNGQKMTREFSGEYQGIDMDFVVLKRPGDISPIYVSQFDIQQQRVTQLKSVDSVVVPLDEKQRKWLHRKPVIEVKYTDDAGRTQTAKGIQEGPYYNPDKPPETLVQVNGKVIKIPNSKILPDGIKLLKSQVDR